MSDDSERAEAGRRLAREYFGSDAPADWEALSPALARMTADFAFGQVWSRPTLELRERALIALAITATLRADHQLGWHVQGGLRAGLSPDEIREALITVAGLAGFPAAWNALAVAEPLLREHEAAG